MSSENVMETFSCSDNKILDLPHSGLHRRAKELCVESKRFFSPLSDINKELPSLIYPDVSDAVRYPGEKLHLYFLEIGFLDATCMLELNSLFLLLCPTISHSKIGIITLLPKHCQQMLHYHLHKGYTLRSQFFFLPIFFLDT